MNWLYLLNNLPSGYHRDLQLTKEVLFPAFETLKSCINMTIFNDLEYQFREMIFLKDEKIPFLFISAARKKKRTG